MKKLVLLAVFAFIVLASAQAQTYIVIDTVLVKNTKHEVVKEGIERIERTLVRIFDREQVEKDTMTYLPQTRQLINYFKAGLNTYGELFHRFDTLTYEKIAVTPYPISTGQTLPYDYFLNGNDSTGVGLIHEWDALNVRISELKSNPEITYLDAVQEFQFIESQKAMLEERYKQIKSQ